MGGTVSVLTCAFIAAVTFGVGVAGGMFINTMIGESGSVTANGSVDVMGLRASENENCDQDDVTIATEQTSTIANNSSNDNGTLSCDTLVCSCDAESGIENKTWYVLVSVYVFVDVLAIVLILLTIRNALRIDFIAQFVGVKYVGFGVAVWAFGSVIGSFTAGRLVKYVQKLTLFIISTGLSIFLSLFLIFERESGELPSCVFSLVTGRFHKLKTSAYSILRLWIGVGLTMHFALSIVLPPDTLLWIIVAAASIGMPLYGIVDRNARFLWI